MKSCCYAALLATALIGAAGSATAVAESVKVKVKTTLGDIVLALDGEKAPVTVANFLAYVDEGAYDGTIFHRVIPAFMAQGGGFHEDMSMALAKSAIVNEADNGLKNVRGSIAMARTSDINSATRQFFINVADNAFLDHQSPAHFGYAVFGHVESGMETLDLIEAVDTKAVGHHQNVPVTPVVIVSVERLGESGAGN